MRIEDIGVFGMGNALSVKKLLSVILLIVLFCAVFSPAVSFVGDSNSDDTPVSTNPEQVYDEKARLSNDTYEVDITVIDVQSYPVVGDNWTVRFTTTGTANLTIRAVNETAFDVDLEFFELRCGDNILTTELTDGVIFVENYSCNEIGYETSKVLIAGKHTLEFRFGDDVEYAYNSPDSTWLYVDTYNSLTEGWTPVGADPYLNDTDSSYGYSDADDQVWEEFTFTDLAGTPTVTSANISVYMQTDEEIEVFIWDSSASGWQSLGMQTSATWDWVTINIDAYITSDAEVDACKVYFESDKIGGWGAGNTVDVDCARLGVVYEVPNNPPVFSSPGPANESTGQSLTPVCNITVSDQDGGTVDVYFYENTTGPTSWVLQQTNSSVAVSSPANVVWNNYNNASSYSTKYWWKVNVSDGNGGYDEEIYHFTTNYAPVLSNPGPSNSSIGQSLTPICNVTTSDQDGGTLAVTFYENTTGPWILQQTNSSHTANTSAQWNDYNNATSYSTTYWWKVNVSDGNGGYDEEIYHFTTGAANNAPEISNPYPTNESISIPTTPTLNITVSDAESNQMNISWYSNSSGSWLLFDTNTTVGDGTYHQTNSNFSQYYKIYWWNVSVNDGTNTNNSGIFHFTTEHSISISIVPSQWNQGSLDLGSSNSTTSGYFNFSNDGTATVNIQIKASNATNSTTGAKWNLSSAPDHNNYTLQYNKSGGGGVWTNINTTYDTFVTNLDLNSWQLFDLKLIAAITSSKTDPMSVDVTLKAVAA